MDTVPVVDAVSWVMIEALEDTGISESDMAMLLVSLVQTLVHIYTHKK